MEDPLSRLRLLPGASLTLAGQLRHRLGLMIADGELDPGSPLPSVRALSRRLGVSVNTVRTAYGRLHADGLLEVRQGAGTRVARTLAPDSPVAPVRFGSNVVGVIMADLAPFYLPVLEGVEDVAARHGMLVVVATALDSPVRGSLMARRLVARGVDGLIALSMGPPRDVLGGEGPESSVPPIVYVDRPGMGDHSFVFDAERGARLATAHLVEHGHRRIAMLTPPLELPNVRPLHDGYARALHDAGLPRPPELVVQVPDFTAVAGQEGARRLFDLRNRASGVFAASDLTAMGLLEAARAAGVRVPEDLAVVGYPDIQAAPWVQPPLTMVAVPAREAGARAMETLVRLIAGESIPGGEVVLEVELVIRESCGVHDLAS
jgi:DNA-binding LacI/PurR family transcriptional regulator